MHFRDLNGVSECGNGGGQLSDGRTCISDEGASEFPAESGRSAFRERTQPENYKGETCTKSLLRKKKAPSAPVSRNVTPKKHASDSGHF